MARSLTLQSTDVGLQATRGCLAQFGGEFIPG